GYDSPEEVFPERKIAGGTITWADGTRETFAGNRMFKLRPGELYTSHNPGGGGCGDPLDREPERVAEDVRNKRVSVEAARMEYGVVVDPKSIEPDPAETERLRAELRRSRPAHNGSAAEGRA
ncbi:MAG: hydantoinase B/oxoprolinase family protein, partial [Actinomycetota bacterium]|nr:hydantoinase B/oxoprolinase family protein [Actinomycetota bacterium]